LIKAVQVGSENIVLALVTTGNKTEGHCDDFGLESLLGDLKDDDLFDKDALADRYVLPFPK
jgi:hypothetical protein